MNNKDRRIPQPKKSPARPARSPRKRGDGEVKEYKKSWDRAPLAEVSSTHPPPPPKKKE